MDEMADDILLRLLEEPNIRQYDIDLIMSKVYGAMSDHHKREAEKWGRRSTTLLGIAFIAMLVSIFLLVVSWL